MKSIRQKREEALARRQLDLAHWKRLRNAEHRPGQLTDSYIDSKIKQTTTEIENIQRKL